jgi:hypothetical protein
LKLSKKCQQKFISYVFILLLLVAILSPKHTKLIPRIRFTPQNSFPASSPWKIVFDSLLTAVVAEQTHLNNNSHIIPLHKAPVERV